MIMSTAIGISTATHSEEMNESHHAGPASGTVGHSHYARVPWNRTAKQMAHFGLHCGLRGAGMELLSYRYQVLPVGSIARDRRAEAT